MSITAAQPKSNHACPVCGDANQCAPARSGSFDTPCWCTSVTIPAANTEASADSGSCLCIRCATAPHGRRLGAAGTRADVVR